MSLYTDASNWFVPYMGDYKSVKTLSWEVGKKGSGLWYDVEPGFEFNVSVPWYARLFFDKRDPRFMKASCLHDHALEHKWSRVAAASLFADALAAEGVSRLKRYVGTLAVITLNFR